MQKYISRVIKYDPSYKAPNIHRQYIEDINLPEKDKSIWPRCMCGEKRVYYGGRFDVFCKSCFKARLPEDTRTRIYSADYRIMNSSFPGIKFIKSFIYSCHVINEYLEGIRVQSQNQKKYSKSRLGRNHRLKGVTSNNLQNYIDAQREWFLNNPKYLDDDIAIYFCSLPLGKDYKWRI
jgi:hypothetical protein